MDAPTRVYPERSPRCTGDHNKPNPEREACSPIGCIQGSARYRCMEPIKAHIRLYRLVSSSLRVRLRMLALLTNAHPTKAPGLILTLGQLDVTSTVRVHRGYVVRCQDSILGRRIPARTNERSVMDATAKELWDFATARVQSWVDNDELRQSFITDDEVLQTAGQMVNSCRVLAAQGFPITHIIEGVYLSGIATGIEVEKRRQMTERLEAIPVMDE